MQSLLRLKPNWDYKSLAVLQSGSLAVPDALRFRDFGFASTCGLVVKRISGLLDCSTARLHDLFHHQIASSDIAAIESAKHLKTTIFINSPKIIN